MEMILKKGMPTRNDFNISLTVFDSYDRLCAEAALTIARRAVKGIIDSGRYSIGCSYGTSLGGVYRALGGNGVPHVDWDCVRLLQTEEVFKEYGGGSGGYVGCVLRFLKNNLTAPAGELVSIQPEMAAQDEKEYVRSIESFYSKKGAPDLMILSLEAKGGLGLIQKTDSFVTGVHAADVTVTDAGEETRLRAVVPGFGNFSSAGQTLLICCGSNRAYALRELMFGEVRPELPVTGLRYCPELTVFATAEAARLVRDYELYD